MTSTSYSFPFAWTPTPTLGVCPFTPPGRRSWHDLSLFRLPSSGRMSAPYQIGHLPDHCAAQHTVPQNP
jgi:hypothetical protein